ncbi:MAG: indole-3-glycerol phosphate synthase TrpC [Verrucomicrobiaceae bacterium]|nr:indole-3-glycerol phosphate synthase TrpC [Verrucomicrobiaceae bacterium]
MNKLDEIIAHKHTEVAKLLPRLEKLKAAAALRNDFRSLATHLRSDPSRLGLIAEVKKASPSVGVINPNFDYLTIARTYDKAGASAISVLTDEKYFQGALNYMTTIRDEVAIPVLRKDFMVHEVQIYEAVVAGADAILLIVAALDQATLEHLLEVARSCQLEVLMEVHDLREMDRALDTDARIIGINNRNLQTFIVDISSTEELAEEVPDDIVLVSESGIKTVEDAQRIAAAGADALLVGETLMRSGNVLVDLPALMVAKE